MPNQNVAILKAAVCVAWADGVFKDSEQQLLEGILTACQLSPEEMSEIRAYAVKPHTLSELDVSGLSLADCRTMISHAVAMAHADRNYCTQERQTILALCERFGMSATDAHALIEAANARITR